MSTAKASIIAQLQKEILPLQGFKRTLNSTVLDLNLGPLKHAFPNASFPLGAVHEFFFDSPENASATTGFVASIIAALMKKKGAALWIGNAANIFPPALQSFGIDADRIIFITLQKERDILWTIEEALKCEGLAAVVGEIQELSFTSSRRLQLAVEQSQTTGFILRCNARSLNTTACLTRWQIGSVPGSLPDGLPGVGFPRWNVALLKVRNGKPGNWQIECAAGKFRPVTAAPRLVPQPQKKTG